MTLLFLPKILSAVLILFRRQDLRLHGGPGRLATSLFLEMLFSAILAPVRMLFHTRYVLGALLGFAVQWKSPPRDDAATPWGEAIKRHGLGTLLGLGWGAYVYTLDKAFLWWLLPVAGSLAIAIPVSVWSSRSGIGRWFRQRRLFLIPEESFPPRELRWLKAGLRRNRAEPPDFHAAVTDPLINALACAAGMPREMQPEEMRKHRSLTVQKALARGPGGLSDPERNLLLSDPVCLSRLHGLAWTAPEASPEWTPASPN